MTVTPDLSTRLFLATIGSCDCATKSPELQYHAPGCSYRLYCEAATELDRRESLLRKCYFAFSRISETLCGTGDKATRLFGALEIARESFKALADPNTLVFCLPDSPDAGALASQQKEEPPMKQVFAYTAREQNAGETYVKFAQLFAAGDAFELTVRNGAGVINSIMIPAAQAHEMAAALVPPPTPDAPAALTDGGKAWDAAVAADPILQFFTFDHLPERLQAVSAPFCHLAIEMVVSTPRNPERTVALRKLLEAKDAAVRALLFK